MLIPVGTHVLVADGARWSLFRNSGPLNEPRLEMVDQDEQQVERTSEMGDDRPGRSFQSMQNRSSSYEVSDRHKMEEDRFATGAADRLQRALDSGDDRAILVAAPRVLSVIRERLGPSARQSLIAVIDKDYTAFAPDELADLLERHAD